MSPENKLLELRAAALAAEVSDKSNKEKMWTSRTHAERHGWMCHYMGWDVPDWDAEGWAGWLARQIVHGDD